jgi:1-acyl-sn-glycerol-3-phosphate acyltransferase
MIFCKHHLFRFLRVHDISMLKFLPAPVVGILCSILLGLNTLILCTILYIPALLKVAIPIKASRTFWSKVIIWIAECWITLNSGWMRLFQRTQWDIKGLDGLKPSGWYLVLSNHQSWVDIFVLQHVLNRRVPFLKFFLKQELIWVPVIGLAWWGMDFPFMKRYSPAKIAKHPELKGKDLETTRKACEKFKTSPVCVMNFVEGSRFTPGKHAQQDSPFQHLLKPKPGGTAFVLNAMGEKIATLLNVTIVYPEGRPSFWDFLCGRIPAITVRLEQSPIPTDLLGGSYADDPLYRERFKAWLNGLWETKDKAIDALAPHQRLESKP